MWRDSFAVALEALFFSSNKDFFLPSAVFLFAGVLAPSAASSPSLVSLSVHRSHQRPSRCIISHINAVLTAPRVCLSVSRLIPISFSLLFLSLSRGTWSVGERPGGGERSEAQPRHLRTVSARAARPPDAHRHSSSSARRDAGGPERAGQRVQESKISYA